MTQPDVNRLVNDAHGRGLEIAPGDQQSRYYVLSRLADDARNPHRGLRRWVVRTSSTTSTGDRINDFYLELHHDGTVALGCRLNRNTPVIRRHYVVSAELIESFAAELVGLAHASALFRSIDAPMAVRLDLVRPDPSTPLAIVSHYHLGSYADAQAAQPAWARPVRRFVPLETEITAADETGALRDRSRELALDSLHQFAHEPLRIIPPQDR